MSYMQRIVSLYLDYAELQAEHHIPISMEDWAKRLDGFLEFNGNEILKGAGKSVRSKQNSTPKRDLRNTELFRTSFLNLILTDICFNLKMS